jgi:MoaA/NifB/PqqE/SkfB family radical SAM enzyme
MKILENDFAKMLVSEECSYFFRKADGYTEVWGKTRKEDPLYSPYGNFIADIEISTICGTRGKLCPFCYKQATQKGEYMPLDTFKKLFAKLPKTLTQIAFGTGEIDSNPDTFEIFQYTRDQGVIPNVTINGRITKEEAEKLSKVCGAVSISHYSDDTCYSAVEMLSNAGLKQVNIHQLVSLETEEQCKQVLLDAKTDPRLKGLGAIVFLSLKQRGRGEGYHVLPREKRFELFRLMQESKIGYGMDSCGASLFLSYIKATNQPELEQFIEPCESGLYSFYIDVEGRGYPCSFSPGTPGWETGIDVLNSSDFLQDVWFDKKVVEWREGLLKCSRSCPIYKV